MDNTLNDFSKSFFEKVKNLGYDLNRTRYEKYDLGSGIKHEEPLKILEKVFNIPNFF